MDTNQRFLLLLVFALGASVGIILESHIFQRSSPQPFQKSTDAPHLAGSESTPLQPTPAGATEPVNQGPEPKSREQQEQATGTPKLVVDQPTFNFGSMERGSLVKHAFVLRNVGDGPLKIDHIKPACGCTVAKLSSEVIQPGSEAQLEVSLNLKLQEGAQNRTILVQSNDPEQPGLELAMVGTATTRVIREPKRVDFGPLSEVTKPVEKVLEVRAIDGLSLEVTGTRTSGEQISANVEAIEAGKHYRVTISLKPTVADGRFSGWVQLQTNDSGEYRLIGIPVSAIVGDGLASQSSSPYSSLIGQQMEISGPTLQGKTIDITEMQDHPVVVVFWASWCGYCKKELPQLVALLEQHSEQGLRIVGVNVDQDTEKAKEACRIYNVPWQNIHFPSNGDQSFKNPISARYSIGGIPAVFLLDHQGKVVANVRGDELKEQVRQLLSKGNRSEANAALAERIIR